MGRIAQETAIPGIVSQFPNQNAEMLKRGAWTEVLGLLGSNGDEIMMQLLFDCGIFTAINARRGIYYQLSGMHGSRLKDYPTIADILLGLPLSVLEPMSDASLGPNRSAIREKEPIATHGQKQGRNTSEQNSDKKLRTPNNIVFLRRRMLYGRAESKSEAPTGLGQKRTCLVCRCDLESMLT